MSSLDYLQLLKNGLPDTDAPRRDIIIVGAGIAGLTAGLLLKEAGHNVTILEAQNRLGGRIYTYHGFPGKMYGEFGAMRFPRQHPLGQYLIHEKFALATRPFPMYDEDTFIFMNGKRVRRAELNPQEFGFQLPAHEAGQAPADLLRGAVQPLIDIMTNNPEDAAWGQLAAEFDQYAVIDYLRARGLSEQAIAMMGPLMNLEPRLHFSLVEWFAHYYDDVFGDLVFIEDGADALPNAFQPYLMDDIRLGAEVHAIEQNDQGVTVHFRAAGRSRQLSGDECLITMPFVLLRHLEIEGLDHEKWYAIRNAYYDRAHKIFMQFSERWWQTKYQITHGLTVTDLAIRNVVYTPAGQDERFRRGVLIGSYAWGQDSMAFSPLPESDRIFQALQDLSKIHPEAQRTFEYGISHDWAQDRYAGGIGPLFRPFEMSGGYFDDLVRPVNRLWFANDACDRRHRRWIEGALRAAVKNAFALHTGMRNQLPWQD